MISCSMRATPIKSRSVPLSRVSMYLPVSDELDGYLVEFDRHDGWRCKCGNFERFNVCEHTQRLALMKAIEDASAANLRQSYS
jgi:hypothetical protein